MMRVNNSENMCMFSEFFLSRDFILIFSMVQRHTTWLYDVYMVYSNIIYNAMPYATSIWRLQPPYIYASVSYLLVLWWFPLFAISFSLLLLSFHKCFLPIKFISSFLFPFPLRPSLSFSFSLSFMAPISMAQVKQK